MRIKIYFLVIFILLITLDILINSQHFFYTLKKDFFTVEICGVGFYYKNMNLYIKV